ncbi:MAG: hypothetical protein HQ500_02035 [Flavobacteriales bacterium]|nr:hypothetical protein [Flavobacteriales bacterium]
MKRTYLLLALIVWAFFAHAQQDSLLRVFHSRSADTTRIDALLQYTESRLKESDTDDIIELGEDAVRLSERIDDERFLSKALRVLALGYDRRGDNRTAKSYAQQSLDVILDVGRSHEVHEAFTLLEYLSFENLNYSQAIEVCNRHILWAESANIPWIKAEALNRLADVYYSTEEIEQALHFAQKAFALYDDLDFPERKLDVQLTIAHCYESLKEHALAKPLYQEIRDAGNISPRLSLILDFQMALCDLGLSSSQEVPEAFLSCLKRADSLGSISMRSYIASSISKVYLGQGELDSAVAYAKLGRDVAVTYGLTKEYLDNLRPLIESYKRLGDFKEAFRLQERLTEFSDSVMSKEQEEAMIRNQLNADFRRQRAIDRAEQDANLQRQRFIIWTVISLFILLSILAYTIYRGRKRANDLLLNILPMDVAKELQMKGYADPREFGYASVLFSDFVGFTDKSATLSPSELVSEIDDCFRQFDFIMEKYGIEKIKTIGDAYMAASGLNVPRVTGPKEITLAALEMQHFIRERKKEHDELSLPAFDMCIGIHTGPVIAGIVGVKKFQYDIWGDTVNTASRIESSGDKGKVNLSQSTYNAIREDKEFVFESRGKMKVKGKGEMSMWYVERRESKDGMIDDLND